MVSDTTVFPDEKFRSMIAKAARVSFYQLLCLNLALGMYVLATYRHVSQQETGPVAFILLGVFVRGTIALLRFVRTIGAANDASRSESRSCTPRFCGFSPVDVFHGNVRDGLTESAILVPGLLIGLALLLSGRYVFAITAYFPCYASALLRWSPKRSNRPQRNVRRERRDCEDEHQQGENKCGNENERDIAGDDDEIDPTFRNADVSRSWDGNLCMTLTRSRSPEGEDHLESYVRGDFSGGQRTASLHVSFCPGFDARPLVETYQIEGEEIEITLAQVNPLGVRLDLKRPAHRKDAETVRLYLSARHVPGESAGR